MHLANGDIDVQRSILPPGTAGVDETVARMQEMAKGEYGAKSSKIRALAINIINAAGIGDKDYYGMAKAIHNWVRDEVRYVKDPVGQETLSFPEETAFNSKAGDCDDKTILEIALLGSIGIRAYPVVIGVRPGHYSHVYCHVEIPQGGRPGRRAGETIPADPIMREWEFGREAPPEKIAQKKTYEDLAGLGDLPRRRRRGTMPTRKPTMSLGSYVTGPSYLDQQNVSSVGPAMRAALVDTAGRGEILNAPKVDEHNTDEVDRMFDAGAVSVFRSAPRWDIASYGPVTGAEASGSIDPLKVRTYETPFGPTSFASNRRTRVVNVPTRALPGLAPSGVMVDQASDDSVAGLGQIAEYINSIMGEGLSGKPEKVVAAAYLAHRRAATRKAKLAANAGFLPGMGDEQADFLPGMGDVIAAKKAARNTVRLAGAAAPKRVVRATRALARLDAAGVVGRIEALPIPTAHKVALLHRALYTPFPLPNESFPGDSRPAASIQPALYTRLPAGGQVQAHAGALAEDMEGLGRFGFRVRAPKVRPVVWVKGLSASSAGALKGARKGFWRRPGMRSAAVPASVAALTSDPVAVASQVLAPLGVSPLNAQGHEEMHIQERPAPIPVDASLASVATSGMAMRDIAGDESRMFEGLGASWGHRIGKTFKKAIADPLRRAAIDTGAFFKLKPSLRTKRSRFYNRTGANLPTMPVANMPTPPVIPVTPNNPVTPQTPYDPNQAVPNEQQFPPTEYGAPFYNPSHFPPVGSGYDPNAYSASASAPPVDTFGPEDMGPAQFAENAGSDRVFTTAMVARGDQAPAQWSGGDAPADQDSGERPEVFMDEGEDESEGVAPRRVRRVRRVARQQPVEVEEVDEVYLVEDEMDEGNRSNEADVAGLGALTEAEVEVRAKAAYDKLDDKKNAYTNPTTRQYWREAVIAWDGGPAATKDFQARWAKRKADDEALRKLEEALAIDTTPEIIPGRSTAAKKEEVTNYDSRGHLAHLKHKPNYTVPVIVGVLGLATVLFLANRK